jgi:predicted enzyme related to lactoylglutathione lyase
MANPFCHIELNTTDVGKAQKFYKGLFDWNYKPMPAMEYVGIDVGQGTGGGMQKLPMPGVPPHWLPYVEVADVKKTIAKAKKLGATIMLEFMALGEMGSIGVFADPAGAPIGVWAPGAAAPAPASKKGAAKKPAAKKAGAPAKKAPAKKPAAKPVSKKADKKKGK